MGVHVDESGADNRAVDSSVSRPVSTTSPILAMRPSWIAMSASNEGLPGSVHHGGITKDEIKHVSFHRESRRLPLRRRCR